MLVIALSVAMRVPHVRAWRNLCFGSNKVDAYPCSIEGVFIDVYTQKGGRGLSMQGGVFGPQENVTLYAEVTNNTIQVPDREVMFEAYGPTNPYNNIFINKTAITNASGIASTSFRIPWFVEHPEEIVFGIWNVSARVDFGEIVICDTLTFEVGYIVDIISVVTGTLLDETYWIPRVNFTKEKFVDVKLVAKNIAFTPKNVWLSIGCYDKDDRPIAYVTSNFTILERTTEELFLQIGCIPYWTSVGKATVYADALDCPPWEGGTCYCPVRKAEILIMEGIEDAIPPSIGIASH